MSKTKSRWHPYDSSKTRVCPAFRVISKNPLPFWKLLVEEFALPILPQEIKVEEMVYADSDAGSKEMSLNPNPDYLRWMLQHPKETKICKCLAERKKLRDSDEKRLALLDGGEGPVNEGLLGLDECERRKRYGKKWYVLEGATKPDVYIRTNKFYLVVEGKRTEGGPEKETLWDSNRHQIVRHLEGLRVRREDEGSTLPIYGMFIAREKDRSKFDIYRGSGPFKESLPHIGGRDNTIIDYCYFDEIRNAYLGMISWGALYKAYNGKIQYFTHVLEDGTLEPYGGYDLEE